MFLSLISPASAKVTPTLPLTLVVDHVGSQDAALRRLTFQPHRDIDAVAEDVVPLDDDVAEIDADPELDRRAGCLVALAHRALDRNGALDRIDDAAKFDQCPIAHHLGDAAVAPGDGGIESLAPDPPQRRDRARLVGADHAAVAGDISGKDSGEASRDLLFGHAASRAGC